MMRSLLLIFALFLSLPAWAELAIVANCSEGKGCTFELSDFERGVFDPEFDRPVEPDDIIVFGHKKNGGFVKYLTKKSRGAIDRDWGGDGFTQLALFNPQIQPRDGLWRATYGTATGTDCYGIGNIGATFRRMIAPGKAGEGDIQFQSPFNPRQLFPTNEMKWKKTGYNTYKGAMGFNNKTMKMFYQIHIVSNEKIETLYTTEINVPTKEPCVGKIPVTFTLIKSKERNDDFPHDNDVDDDLLPIHPKGNKEDDLLPVKPKGSEDELLEVKPKDGLLPVKPGQKPKTEVERLDRTKVERIKD